MKKMGVCTWMFYKPAPTAFLESVGAVTIFGSPCALLRLQTR